MIHSKRLLVALATSMAFLGNAQAIPYTYDHFDLAINTLLGYAGSTFSHSVGGSGDPAFTFSSYTLPSGTPTSNVIDFTVTAHPGYEISGIQFRESGRYSLGDAGAFLIGQGKATFRQNVSSSNGTDTTGTWEISGSGGGPLSTVAGRISYLLWPTDGATGQSDGGFFKVSTVLAPVPEPGTYGMLLAGLGILGALTRRTRTGR